MTLTAILLGHDDQCLGEFAIPQFQPVVLMAQPTPCTARMWDEQEWPSLTAIEVRTRRFHYDPIESELRQMIDHNPHVAVYRLESW